MQKKWVLVLFPVLAVVMTGCGMEQVDEGYRGIETNWGKVIGDPLPPGLHFYNPVSSSIFEMDVREQKLEAETTAFTRDTQSVVVKFAITYYPDPAKIGHLYSQFGKQWDEKIVLQAVLGSLKDAIGQYIADDLVSKREVAKATAEKEIKSALADRGVTVTRLDFTNLDFDDAYEKAVENKVVAIQRAAESKNKTVQVEEEAKQKVTAAQADAESMRIKSQALSQNKGLVEYEAIQKWNGKLPEIMLGNSVPIINLEKLKKD
jgi:prohibitin 2